jgi:hypothetical protein
MPVCPWCKAAVPRLSGPCPKCGKALADVPELDIPIPARASKGQVPVAPRAGAAPPPPAPVVLPDHGNIDTDVLGGDDVSLDLDLSKGPPVHAAMPSHSKVPAAPPNAMLRMSPSASASTSVAPKPLTEARAAAPAPMVRAADAAGPRSGVDPYEARALSDYGEAPSQWFKLPLYALRVLRRRPELKKIVGVKRREADRTRGAADDALTAFAELVRPTAEKLAAFTRPLDDVRMTEQVMRERDAVLGTENDAHKARQAEVDAKLAELEAQLGQIQAEERGIQAELAESDALLKRAEARVKRIDIEVRNALEQAGGGPPGSDSKGAR